MKLFWLLLLLGPLGTIAQPANDYVLHGRIQPDPAWADYVYLLKLPAYHSFFSTSLRLVVDSARVQPDGSFGFGRRAHLDQPSLYRLSLPPRSMPDGAALPIGSA